MTTQIQIRRDTAANWDSVNPVLAEGEIGMDMTTNAFKVGDGVSAWNDIEYAGSDISLDDYYTKTEADDAFQPKGDYLTDFVEEDPTVPDHVKGITQDDIDAWNAGGNDPRISNTQITNWDTAHGWGNHASAGYAKSTDIPTVSYPVTSVNGKTGAVSLSAGDVGAQPAGSYAPLNHNHSGVYAPASHDHSGVYAPASHTHNYAPVGASYTKAESDNKYELKGAGGLPAGDWACSGNITAAGNITAYSSSDERLKDDIKEMPVGLIDSVQPSMWNWKEGGKASGGVVAQQLQECGLGNWVHEAPDGTLGVDYNALIGVLISEVKALKSRVEELESAD